MKRQKLIDSAKVCLSREGTDCTTCHYRKKCFYDELIELVHSEITVERELAKLVLKIAGVS